MVSEQPDIAAALQASELSDPVQMVRHGIEAARAQQWELGFALLGEAYRRFSREPEAAVPPATLSYYGLCLAMHRGRTKEAAEYCELALDREFFRADFYWNLGQVWIRAGHRRKAVEAIERGLAVEPQNPRLTKLMESIGVRRQPVLSFLHRDNPLNVSLGKVRHSMARKKDPKPSSTR